MRRFLRKHPYALAYLFAAATYILFGMWQKFALNWIVGPLWLVACVELAPQVRRIASRAYGRERVDP